MNDIEYGLVKIIKGKYEGRFGFYDDDELDEEEIISHPIVYLGERERLALYEELALLQNNYEEIADE